MSAKIASTTQRNTVLKKKKRKKDKKRKEKDNLISDIIGPITTKVLTNQNHNLVPKT